MIRNYDYEVKTVTDLIKKLELLLLVFLIFNKD